MALDVICDSSYFYLSLVKNSHFLSQMHENISSEQNIFLRIYNESYAEIMCLENTLFRWTMRTTMFICRVHRTIYDLQVVRVQLSGRRLNYLKTNSYQSQNHMTPLMIILNKVCIVSFGTRSSIQWKNTYINSLSQICCPTLRVKKTWGLWQKQFDDYYKANDWN